MNASEEKLVNSATDFSEISYIYKSTKNVISVTMLTLIFTIATFVVKTFAVNAQKSKHMMNNSQNLQKSLTVNNSMTPLQKRIIVLKVHLKKRRLNRAFIATVESPALRILLNVKNAGNSSAEVVQLDQ